MEKLKLLIWLLFSLCATSLMAQSPDSTLTGIPFTSEEAKATKDIAQSWLVINIIYVIAGLVVAIIGSYFGLRKQVQDWAMDKAMSSVAAKLNLKTEVLEAALKQMTADFQLRQKALLVVRPDDSNNLLTVKNYLSQNHWVNVDHMILGDFKNANFAKYELVVFNYLNQDLATVEKELKEPLLSLKNNCRIVVLGTGRLDNSFKETLGNQLNFSNGLDTLNQRILDAFKQPV